MFGTNPRFFFPCAYAQFLRFPGTELTDLPIDQLELNGAMPAIAELAKGKIKANNATTMERGSEFKDILLNDYPEW